MVPHLENRLGEVVRLRPCPRSAPAVGRLHDAVAADVVNPQDGAIARVTQSRSRSRPDPGPRDIDGCLPRTISQSARGLHDVDTGERGRLRRTGRPDLLVPYDETFTGAVERKLGAEGTISRRELRHPAPARRAGSRRAERERDRGEGECEPRHELGLRTTTLRENVKTDEPHSSSASTA